MTKKSAQKKYDSVHREAVDAGGQYIRETYVPVFIPDHVNKSDLPAVSPARQINDALTIYELQALAEFAQAALTVEQATSAAVTMPANSNEAGGSSYSFDRISSGSSGKLPMTQRQMDALRKYDHIYESLCYAHQQFIDRFLYLISIDVGHHNKKRMQAVNALREEGQALIARKNKDVALGGLAGYLKAVSQVILEESGNFDRLMQAETECKRRQRMKAIQEYAHSFKSSR